MNLKSSETSKDTLQNVKYGNTKLNQESTDIKVENSLNQSKTSFGANESALPSQNRINSKSNFELLDKINETPEEQKM